MEKFFLGILLAFIPIISYFFQYFIAKKNKRLVAFRNFLPVQIMDWVFIPFNLIWIYIINLNFVFNFYLVILTFFGALILFFWWGKEDPKNSKWEDYSFRKGRFRAEGWVHGVYAIIQGFMVVVFLLSSIKSILSFIGSLLLLIYFMLGVIAIKKLHRKFSPPDLFYIISGLIISIIKIIFSFI